MEWTEEGRVQEIWTQWSQTTTLAGPGVLWTWTLVKARQLLFTIDCLMFVCYFRVFVIYVIKFYSKRIY